MTLAALDSYGYDFEEALRSERLVYLYYRPPFLHSLSLGTDDIAVFAEIQRLTGNIQRLALLNAALFFNLQSEHLAFASVSSATAAARQSGSSILGCWVPQPKEGHRSLRAACTNLMPPIRDRNAAARASRNYRLTTNKAPSGHRDSVILNLDTAYGHTKVSSNAEIA